MAICDSVKTQNMLRNIKSYVLEWGCEYIFKKRGIIVKIKAIPAYHGNNFVMRKIVGVVNGYLLNIKSGNKSKTIYITGDTVYHKNIVSKLPDRVDAIIANMGNAKSQIFGGPLTMNVDMLRKFDSSLNPKTVIPIHVDDFAHYDMTPDDISKGGYNIILPGDIIQI